MCEKCTSKETPDISMAFKEMSLRSLSGVETRNSGSQLLKLQQGILSIEDDEKDKKLKSKSSS